MANTVTQTLESLVKSFMDSLLYMPAQLNDMQKLYFTDVSARIAGLTGGDPVTVTTKLTKTDMISGITLTEQLEYFLSNSNMATSDYHATLIKLTNGAEGATAEISPGTEKLGDDLNTLATTLLDLFQKGQVIASMYTDNEIDDLLTAIEATRIVYGASVTASLLSAGITLVVEYAKFVNNQATITGDYSNTANQWQSVNGSV